MPLAANEESWSVVQFGGAGETMSPESLHAEVMADSVPNDKDRDTADSPRPGDVEVSPSSGSKVVFASHKQMRRYPSELPPADDMSFRSGRLQSESDSVFVYDDIKDLGMHMKQHSHMPPIQETDSAQARSLIRWGPEIASYWDLLFPMFGILGYLIDVGSDIMLAFEYYSVRHYWWFILTLSFVLLPSVAMSIFSLILWVRNSKILKEEISIGQWIIRSISLLLLVSPIVR